MKDPRPPRCHRAGTGRRLTLGLLLATLAPPAPAAPRDPIARLQAGLAAAPDEAGLAALIAGCFDLPRTARDILAGLPEVDARAEARLAAALDLRLRHELRRRPPVSPDIAWIEDRPLGPGEWLVMTRLPARASEPRGEVQILAWRVREDAVGARIIDVLRDGVSGMRTRRAEFGGLVRRVGLEAALAAEEAAARAEPVF